MERQEQDLVKEISLQLVELARTYRALSKDGVLTENGKKAMDEEISKSMRLVDKARLRQHLIKGR